MDPSKPVLTTKVIEHAQKRKKQRKTSKQRRISKAKKQMTAMGIIVGGLRADSEEEEEGAEAEEEEGAKITKKEKLGKLIALYKWRLAQFNMSDAKREGGAKWRGLSQLMEEHISCMALHYRNSGSMIRQRLWQTSTSIRGSHY